MSLISNIFWDTDQNVKLNLKIFSSNLKFFGLVKSFTLVYSMELCISIITCLTSESKIKILWNDFSETSFHRKWFLVEQSRISLQSDDRNMGLWIVFYSESKTKTKLLKLHIPWTKRSNTYTILSTVVVVYTRSKWLAPPSRPIWRLCWFLQRSRRFCCWCYFWPTW